MTKFENDQYKKCTAESHGMCYICQRPAVHIHHAFGGANRDKSTQYGLLYHLCVDYHFNAHHNFKVKKMLRDDARKKFVKEHPDLDFLKTFGRNY